MKILCICEPSKYQRASSDIPIFYQRLALDPRASSFHLPVENVFKSDRSKDSHICVAPVVGTLSYNRFLQLNLQAQQWHPLESFNLVFCRTLKPFPQGYLDRLRSWETYTQFVNSPTGKIEQIHPSFLWQVAGKYTPEMVVTSNSDEAQAFFERHRTIVAKRANSCGGRGVFKIWYQDRRFKIDNIGTRSAEFSEFAHLMNYLQGQSPQPVQLMRYLRRVDEGDKRVIVVDGEIYGAFIRRSKSGYWVNNISGDGECYLAEVSDAEREAIDNTISHYRDRGLLTLGYDFLQDEEGIWRISEINAGNIGGFAKLEALTNQPIMQRFISWLIDFGQSGRSNILRNM